VEGSINGWDDVPVPETNHFLLAVVLYSRTTDLDDPANTLDQGVDLNNVPRNACVKAAGLPIQPPCAWRATVRVGAPTTLYGALIDIDTKGNDDDSDNESTVVGFLSGPSVTLNDGGSQTGAALDILDAGDVNDVSVTFPSIPAGLTEVIALPILDKGDEWFAFVPMTPDAASGKLPATTGAFAGGEYFLLANASSATSEGTASGQFIRDVPGSGAIVVPEFLALPTGVSASAGTYSFTAVASASLHGVDFKDADGATVWNVALLDGSTSFTLPTLSPDPLASATRMQVNAFIAQGFDPGDFEVGNLIDFVQKLSSDSVELD
jgi:hypothetical protein